MSPLRKRPQCQKCGHLMAGHKRPNGIVTCPTEHSPEPLLHKAPIPIEVDLPVLGAIKAGEVYHYRNPNWEEPERQPMPYIQRPMRHSGTPDSWVSTEPADDLPVRIKYERQLSTLRESDEVQMMMARPSSVASTSSSVASTSTSARLQRSFSSILNNGVPLLSLFRAQRKDVTTITQAARRNGLHTGVLRPPATAVVKEEAESSSSARRGNPLWVLVGTDAAAVEHIMDLQDNHILAHLDATTVSPSNANHRTADPPYQFSTLGLICFIIAVCAVFIVFLSLL
ncbi:hypothetical protein BDW22DRAFT_1351902 [Trametopsis cervina]|nr:hypothetical protein BDW22DRAFT_1351902 [Trametopsis cervina]